MIFLFSINIKSFGDVTYDANGFGIVNEEVVYQPAKKVETGDTTYPDHIDYYKITNAGNLYWFASEVNSGNTNINAILTQDIEVISPTDTNAYTGLQKLLTGTEYSGLSQEQKTALEKLNWTPIGKDDTKIYTGTFDGNGKTISGLYFSDTNTNNVGLFGAVQNGVIKNIGVKNSYFKAENYKQDETIVAGGLASALVNTIVTNVYSSNCVVSVHNSGSLRTNIVGGLIGLCKGGTVTNSYSSDCTLGICGYVVTAGGLIGQCDGGTVTNSYSSDCILDVNVNEGSVTEGGLIGQCDGGTVTNSYSTNTNLTATGTDSYKGGICGVLFLGTIKNCFYLKSENFFGVGIEINKSSYTITTSDTPGKTDSATDAEFKDGTIRDKLNKDGPCEGYMFIKNKSLDGESKEYLVIFKLGKILKIPVRVKINYDPSNKLENLVSKNFKHEFFRKIDDGGWKTMLEEKQYLYDVSPVSGSIKINPDGSKTQDFIFNYYIYQAKDRNNNIYKFGFNKKYPVDTYIREDVGGGKKLYIDYGVWGRE